MLSTIYGGEDSFLLINLKFKQMENKRAKVIMLPTEDITHVQLDVNNKLLHVHSRMQSTCTTSQHLYFTVDEEIKEGDWFLDTTLTPKNSLDDLEEELIGKIVTTTDTSLNLPSPSPAFIQKYCELGGIDEVLLEYEKLVRAYIPFSNAVDYRLKVDPIHNTVTIHPIKDNWTREEITELLLKYSTSQFGTMKNSKYVTDWIKDNL